MNRLEERKQREACAKSPVSVDYGTAHNRYLTSTRSDGGKLVVEMEMSRFSPPSTLMLPSLMMMMFA